MAVSEPTQPTQPTVLPIPLPKGYQRMDGFPMDESSVFKDAVKLDAYIASPVCYPGQVLSFVNEEENTTIVYKINPDKSKSIVGLVGDAADTSVVKLNEDIQVLGGAIGSFKVGDTVRQGVSVTSILKKILQTAISPSYVAPVFSINPSGIQKVEIGTMVTPVIRPVFVQNDAGSLPAGNNTNYVVEKTTSEIWLKKVESDSPIDFTDEPIQITGDVLRYRSKLSYPDGAVKNNNLGEPDPTGQIIGASITRELSYNGVRNLFYGTSPEVSALLDSDAIRRQRFSSLDHQKGQKITLGIVSGSKEVVIAYPSTLGDIASIKYIELGNTEVKDTFTRMDTDVAGAEGFYPIPYNVYVYRPAAPFGSNATFEITI